jgi:hypothetical protein
MNITIDKNGHDNYDPELYNLLTSMPSTIPLYNSEHRLREPLGIYNVSSMRVAIAFKQMVNTLNNDDNSLNDDHCELISSILAFVDDCYHIFKCFYSVSELNGKKEPIFADRWVRIVNESVVTSFKKDIEPFTGFAKIFNKVKHNHARYRNSKMNTAVGSIKGYYIEGADENGHICPDTDIHPMWNKRYTSTSFNYDIKMLLYCFYVIAGKAAHAIKQIIKTKHGLDIQQNFKDDTRNNLDNWNELIVNIDKIPYLFHPDEYSKDIVPQFIFGDKIIHFRQVAYRKFLNRFSRFNINGGEMESLGDGVSKSFAIPYYYNPNFSNSPS